jgi:hypothetical protein
VSSAIGAVGGFHHGALKAAQMLVAFVDGALKMRNQNDGCDTGQVNEF